MDAEARREDDGKEMGDETGNKSKGQSRVEGAPECRGCAAATNKGLPLNVCWIANAALKDWSAANLPTQCMGWRGDSAGGGGGVEQRQYRSGQGLVHLEGARDKPKRQGMSG